MSKHINSDISGSPRLGLVVGSLAGMVIEGARALTTCLLGLQLLGLAVASRVLGGLARPLGLLRWPVDFLVGHHMAELVGVRDQAFGGIGRDSLSALVVPDIALRAAHALAQLRLRDAEALSNGFDVAHRE